MTTPVLTVGHSTRTLEEFLDLLDDAEVGIVVDVRRLPGSARYPHFDEDPLRDALAQRGIDLRRLPALTGRRPVQRDVPPTTNGWWEHRSFHNYADWTLSADFRAALAELRELRDTAAAHGRTVALMCAEAVWWRCHRRLIADQLLARGEPVVHLMAPGQTRPAELSAGAVLHPDGTLTYPAPDSDNATSTTEETPHP
ncbi:DUF488 domain-containing protein [Flavimobilis sp. GY10621]|uniref:DUF488 domain-containing protein n=1 Tax=Flavimobilis rhizosphaerae TaxID=2775421 RepID=A0ABR9DP84_9MICO|nr:DUF488 domain-containing protein [Flavimobilis rhizosphaerae]MBD9698157.1 DUF488 domain-containing protein [Flavimobilis rhizosphaerae]